MIVKQREVVLLPYPFTNLKTTKVRPGVVISNDKLNRKADDYILVPLTSVLKDEAYSILIGQKDFVSGKLIKPSRIRADKIFTVQKDLIITKIGRLSDECFEKVKSEILEVLS